MPRNRKRNRNKNWNAQNCPQQRDQPQAYGRSFSSQDLGTYPASQDGAKHRPSQEATDKNKDTRKDISLKERAKKTFCQDFKQKEGLMIGKLQMKVHHKDSSKNVQKLSLGKQNNLIKKVILLVGATGTGKTTLINAMANYIFGVDFSDDFRFTIIDEKDDPDRSDAFSQTDYITCFEFTHMSGMPFEYNYVLIDTPGFGDTRGIERDRQMMSQLESFLKQDYGVDQVDSIGFVIPASATRLTQTQKYILDGLSSMFGKDIKNNIVIMATFSDSRKPPVLKALAECGMKHDDVYKFNNSALFARNIIDGCKQSDDSDYDDEEAVSMSRQYWEMASKTMEKFFTSLGHMTPVSLALTKEVLEERRNLQTVLCSLQAQVQLGLDKLSVLNQERQLLSQLDDDMKDSSNHFMLVNVPKMKEVHLKPRECTTNCVRCSFTCHFPCYLPPTQNKKKCFAMINGMCKCCPLSCGWNFHKHMDFRYETTWTEEKRTAQELLARYNKASIGKITKEKLIREMEEDIKNHSRKLMRMIQQIQSHVHRLEVIALKPNPLSTKEYIDLMVQSEKMQKNYNFEKRIEMLQKIKQEIQILGAAKNFREKSQASGESLLTYFQNMTVDTSSSDDIVMHRTKFIAPCTKMEL